MFDQCNTTLFVLLVVVVVVGSSVVYRGMMSVRRAAAKYIIIFARALLNGHLLLQSLPVCMHSRILADDSLSRVLYLFYKC
jgi:hypothetical protein